MDLNFFKRHNEKNEDILSNEYFGVLKKSGDWITEVPFVLKLWNKRYEVYLSVVDDDNSGISKSQEQAYKIFFENQDEFQSKVEQLLSTLFRINDTNILQESIQIDGICFARSGACVMSLSTTLDDDLLAECEIGPDSEFGIELLPELKILTSGEDITIMTYNLSN